LWIHLILTSLLCLIPQSGQFIHVSLKINYAMKCLCQPGKVSGDVNVLGISISPLLSDFWLYFGPVPTMWYFRFSFYWWVQTSLNRHYLLYQARKLSNLVFVCWVQPFCLFLRFFSIAIWKFPDSVVIFCLYFIILTN
jgi:hypothetical protein